ncbi:MAG: D-sedoheptulose 7-phosphate isomerase [Desulfovermiculus sp.]|nr:D-sedoheptulose 7-phosphate isomerase [Desulfovermiculus sp.]
MTQEALSLVQEYVQQGAELRRAFFETNSESMIEVARIMATTLVRGGKILFCGNGSSAAGAQHLAATFLSRFEMERPPLPALALTTNSSVLTAVSDEYGFDSVFEKQIKALGREGDLCVGISTTGQSLSIIHALQMAKVLGLTTVGLLGKDGGKIRGYCDHVLCVSGQRIAHIQEGHMIIGHLWCRLVDYFLFEAADQLQPYL